MSDQQIQEFIDVTGADRETAARFTGMSGGNLETALVRYFEEQEAHPPAQPAAAASPSPPASEAPADPAAASQTSGGSQQPAAAGTGATSSPAGSRPPEEEQRPLLATAPPAKGKSPKRVSPLIHEKRGTRSIVDYNLASVSSLAVFTYFTGTAFKSITLWVELLIACLVFAVGAMGAFCIEQGFKDEWFVVVIPMVQLLRRVSIIATFLLGFYSSRTYDRWWQLRHNGIGQIWSGTCQATMLLSHYIQDPKYLDAINRYARASLVFLSLQRKYRNKAEEKYSWLVEDEILTQEEVDKLKAWNTNLPESVWNWSLSIVMNLHKRGVISSDKMHRQIVEQILLGRTGAEVIDKQLNTPIPMVYVHLIAAMVKAYSISLALWLGAAYGLRPKEVCYIVELVLFVLLFNAFLIICDLLNDPFDGDLCDFPIDKYQEVMAADARSHSDARGNLPSWLADIVKKRQ